jgi:calpain-7
MDRNKLIQKLNEYRHRIEQLERYMETTKTNSTSLYINENSPYQQRRDSRDSDITRTQEDDYNDRAKVKYIENCISL